jgi:uncharacterized damage-inducible protein DinB
MDTTDRRTFLKTAACVAAGGGFALFPGSELMAQGSQGGAKVVEDRLTLVGPKSGFAPGLGTLASMMAFMRSQVVRSVAGLKPAELDFLLDARANSIGALLLHLAATETFYQLHTFQGVAWGAWPDAVKKKWDAASALGEEGRKSIKDRELDSYLSVLAETRARTLTEFKKRDDKWLFTVDQNWFWGPTNNYCKWFHVCEHEANHNGQIKLLKGRLPGAKESSG